MSVTIQYKKNKIFAMPKRSIKSVSWIACKEKATDNMDLKFPCSHRCSIKKHLNINFWSTNNGTLMYLFLFYQNTEDLLLLQLIWNSWGNSTYAITKCHGLVTKTRVTRSSQTVSLLKFIKNTNIFGGQK